MTFFFDRSMGRKIPAALHQLGIDAIAHDDHFAQNTPDSVWLSSVGRRGWVVITKDDRIRFRPAERRALIDHGVGCFVVLRRNATRLQLAQILLRAWDDIVNITDTEARPFLYAVLADGTVERRILAP
jgi:predicted nuclease of predicted toxin-antitoxin system